MDITDASLRFSCRKHVWEIVVFGCIVFIWKKP